LQDSTQNNKNKSTFVLMFLTLISRLLGIVKARVITSAFGASLTADVINTAFYLPNNLRKLFAEGAMNIAFIPSLSKSENKESRTTLLNLMLSFQIILFVILIVLFSFFGRQIFSFISDFNEEGTILGGTLLPYFIGFLSLISLSTIMSSVLQYEKKFLLYGIAPLFFNIVVIIFVYNFSDRLGAMAMAYGVVLGAAFQLIFTLTSVLRLKYRISMSLLFKDQEFRSVLKIWIQVILSNIAILLSQQYSAYLSTTLATGSATAFSNSMIFFSAPYGILFTGIATVSFPELSKHFASKNEVNFKKTLSYASDGILYLFIPTSIALMGLSRESIAVVLQNGLFTYQNTIMTSQVLFHFLFGLTIIGLTGLMLRAAISRGLANLVLKITILQSVIDVVFSFAMVKMGVGIKALAIANNIASFTALIMYFIFLKNTFDFKHFFKTFVKTILLNIPLIIVIVLYKLNASTWFIDGSNIKNLSIFVGISLVLASITLLMYSFFHVPILNFVKRKQK
jgi:putative peptidoglycan lipid II flippase